MKLPNVHILQALPDETREIQDFYTSVGYPGAVDSSDIIIIARYETKLIGVVRLAYEENTQVLRGMHVAALYQKQGIGYALLQGLNYHLNDDQPCFCLPHVWLEDFYGSIGFVKTSPESVPRFLQLRLDHYKKTEFPDLIVMKRTR